jgi:hypothetical protein
MGGFQTLSWMSQEATRGTCPVRDLIVDYLRERQPVLDYNSLRQASRTLSLHYWKTLESIQPGIESIRLSPEVADAWKERVRTKVTRQRQQDGSLAEISSPRTNVVSLLTSVRAFYLDIAQWAAVDPARWGPWAVPCPITLAEISAKKGKAHRKARMDRAGSAWTSGPARRSRGCWSARPWSRTCQRFLVTAAR